MNSFVDNFLIFLHFLSVLCANYKIRFSESITRINRFKRIIRIAWLVSEEFEYFNYVNNSVGDFRRESKKKKITKNS